MYTVIYTVIKTYTVTKIHTVKSIYMAIDMKGDGR